MTAKPHPHAAVIHAYADGQAIQFRGAACDDWKDWDREYCPDFFPCIEYRIKPVKREAQEWRMFVEHGSNRLVEETFCVPRQMPNRPVLVREVLPDEQ